MHCKFEDVESGRVLEVDLSLNEDGTAAEDGAAKMRELEPFKVE
jgi:hypothetical protein